MILRVHYKLNNFMILYELTKFCDIHHPWFGHILSGIFDNICLSQKLSDDLSAINFF